MVSRRRTNKRQKNGLLDGKRNQWSTTAIGITCRRQQQSLSSRFQRDSAKRKNRSNPWTMEPKIIDFYRMRKELWLKMNKSPLPLYKRYGIYSFEVNEWFRRSFRIYSLSACDNFKPQLGCEIAPWRLCRWMTTEGRFYMTNRTAICILLTLHKSELHS
jgi:hypothetical protein